MGRRLRTLCELGKHAWTPLSVNHYGQNAALRYICTACGRMRDHKL